MYFHRRLQTKGVGNFVLSNKDALGDLTRSKILSEGRVLPREPNVLPLVFQGNTMYKPSPLFTGSRNTQSHLNV